MTMTTKKTTDSRRKILKSAAAGTTAIIAGKTLPDSWTKPVINTVMLPAHAATTDDSGSLPGETLPPTTAPATTTPEPCFIDGNYCYLTGNKFFDITVAVDGSIEVFFSNNNGSWDSSTSNDSVPVTGGSFSVRVLKIGSTSNFRIISGDVVCNSDTIDNATFEDQQGGVLDIFPAKGICEQ